MQSHAGTYRAYGEAKELGVTFSSDGFRSTKPFPKLLNPLFPVLTDTSPPPPLSFPHCGL
jgi:hypothetical protein